MSAGNKYPIINAVTNNTFDIDVVNNTLKDIVIESYHTLLNTQKEDVGLNRFNLTNEDLLHDNSNLYITVSKDLIEQYSRRLYKTSDHYNKILSITDLINNKNIFVKIPLLFVDGLMTFGFKIKCDNDKTTLILPFNKELLKNPHKFTVLYIHNTNVISAKLNKFVMSSYNNTLPLTMFNSTMKLSSEYKLFSFIQDTKNLQSSPANKTTISNGNLIIEPTTYSQNIINNAYEFNLVCLGFRYFNEVGRDYIVKERASDNQNAIELCVLDNHDMPIPPENVLVYKYNNVVNDYILNNDCYVERHYPFIYEIKDINMIAGDKYRIRYFYTDTLDDYTYSNLLYPYLKLLSGKLNNQNIEEVINMAYFNNTSDDYYLELFNKYFSFDEYDYKFNMNLYAPNRPDHFSYKIDTMFDFIKHNPEHVRKYVINQNNCGTNFYTFVSNIDLTKRIRTNTINDIGRDFILPEEAYVFKFNKEKNGFIKLRFFIDGMNIIPLYYASHGDFDYIYLPKSKIKSDSFIEIEKFEEYSFSSEVTLNSLNLPTEMVLDDYSDLNFRPTLKDLYILNRNTGMIVSNEKFQISIDIDGVTTPIDGNRYTILDKFYIKLMDSNLDNHVFTVSIGKTQELIQNKYSDGDICQAVLAGNFKRIKNYVRVFYNGRLLPYEFWKLINVSETNKPYLITKFNITEDADVSFDITPYYYELIYSIKEINTDGIIDLKGIIDKPFDLLYYDIYLNGRKLSIPNVINVSTTKIKLINVDTKYNLQIYKKDRDQEYFGFDTEIIKQPIDDLLDDTKISDVDKKIIIDSEVAVKKPKEVDPTNTNSESDFITFEIINGDDFDLLLFIKDQVVQLNHINPDILQLNSFIIRNYDFIFNNMVSDGRSSFKNTIRLNPSMNPTANKVIRISSAIRK